MYEFDAKVAFFSSTHKGFTFDPTAAAVAFVASMIISEVSSGSNNQISCGNDL